MYSLRRRTTVQNVSFKIKLLLGFRLSNLLFICSCTFYQLKGQIKKMQNCAFPIVKIELFNLELIKPYQIVNSLCSGSTDYFQNAVGRNKRKIKKFLIFTLIWKSNYNLSFVIILVFVLIKFIWIMLQIRPICIRGERVRKESWVIGRTQRKINHELLKPYRGRTSDLLLVEPNIQWLFQVSVCGKGFGSIDIFSHRIRIAKTTQFGVLI